MMHKVALFNAAPTIRIDSRVIEGMQLNVVVYESEYEALNVSDEAAEYLKSLNTNEIVDLSRLNQSSTKAQP
jgi:hypothetical protein